MSDKWDVQKSIQLSAVSQKKVLENWLIKSWDCPQKIKQRARPRSKLEEAVLDQVTLLPIHFLFQIKGLYTGSGGSADPSRPLHWQGVGGGLDITGGFTPALPNLGV